MPKFSTHVALMNPEYQPANFAPGDEVPEWALDQVGEHVLVPEDRGESDDSDASGTEDDVQNDGAADETPGDDEDAEGDGDGPTPPAADDQPDFTAPATARRGRSRK